LESDLHQPILASTATRAVWLALFGFPIPFLYLIGGQFSFDAPRVATYPEQVGGIHFPSPP